MSEYSGLQLEAISINIRDYVSIIGINPFIVSLIGKYKLLNLPSILDTSTIKGYYPHHRRINDKISYMIDKQELIPLMKGKYVAGEAYRNGLISDYSIANALYGPSYISAYTALSYYQLIPERVEIIESVTIQRSKSIDTPLGVFQYYKVPNKSFHVGIDHNKKGKVGYLIGSPTKAVIDALWIDKPDHISGAKAMESHLLQNMRIDEHLLKDLNLQTIQKCMDLGKKKRLLGCLLKLAKNGKNK